MSDLSHRFEYHPPATEDDIDRHAEVRRACKFAASSIVALTAPGREQSLALTKIEEAMFWANADIARNK